MQLQENLTYNAYPRHSLTLEVDCIVHDFSRFCRFAEAMTTGCNDE